MTNLNDSLGDTLTEIENDVNKIYESKTDSPIDGDELMSTDTPDDPDLEYSVPCWDCGTTYKSYMGYYNHKRSKHLGVSYSCDQCSYTSTQQGHLKRHKRSVHDKLKHECDHCNFQASEKGILKRHIEVIHNGVYFPCNQCNFRATRRYLLSKHKKQCMTRI